MRKLTGHDDVSHFLRPSATGLAVDYEYRAYPNEVFT